MTKTTTVAARRLRPGVLGLRGALGLLLLLAWQAPALAGNLSIELNKATARGDRCVGSFLIRNELGQTLDRFSLELYVFDSDGVAIKRLLVDLAPLPAGRTTPASFGLTAPCSGIGWLLVSGIPTCRGAADGRALDCMAGLQLRSRDSRIALRQ